MEMTTAWLALLLIAPQDDPKADDAAARARHAAVDRIMAEPAPPKPARPVHVEVVARDRVLFNIRVEMATKQLTYELKKPEATPTPLEEDEDEDDRALRLRAQGIVLRRGLDLKKWALAPDNFDRWVFGEGADAEGGKIALGSLLTEKIFVTQNGRKLTPEQLRKLRTAGSGDIKRFLERVERRRAGFEAVRGDPDAGRDFLERLHPLAVECKQGPFDADSLFAKALRRIEAEGDR